MENFALFFKLVEIMGAISCNVKRRGTICDIEKKKMELFGSIRDQEDWSSSEPLSQVLKCMFCLAGLSELDFGKVKLEKLMEGTGDDTVSTDAKPRNCFRAFWFSGTDHSLTVSAFARSIAVSPADKTQERHSRIMKLTFLCFCSDVLATRNTILRGRI